ncbi:hypothetical protein GCM10023166_36060 [Paeniglutamicibacter cryotolerans]
MLREDASGCGALIELAGSEHEAVTSCGPSSFASGDTVWVARDPAEPARFLVVVAGEGWFEPDAVDRALGVALGLGLGLAALAGGYRGLLRRDAPSAGGPVKPRTLADGLPCRAGPDRDESFLVDAEAGWEGFKASVGHRLERFAESDIRLRGSLMSLVVIAVFWIVVSTSVGTSREMSTDRAIVRSGQPVDVALLEYANDDFPPIVRYQNTRTELAYDLVSGEGQELGDAVKVVVDPHDAGQLIPVSMAARIGLFAWFEAHLHMLVFGLALLWGVGSLLIGREVGDRVSGVMRRLGFGY